VALRVVAMQSLRIRIPEPLLYASRAKEVRAAVAARQEAEDSAGRGPGARASRRFELPEMPRSRGEQTILLPAEAPVVAGSEALRLPQIAFWSAPAIRRPVKKFQAPGRERQRLEAPELTAPPRLEAPAPDIMAEGLRMVSRVASESQPKLPVRWGAGSPVRIFKPPSGRAEVNRDIDLLVGEPVNVIALHPNPAPMRPLVVVTGGSRIGVLPPMGEAGGGAPGGVSAVESKGAGAGPPGAGSGAGSGQGAGLDGGGPGRNAGGAGAAGDGAGLGSGGLGTAGAGGAGGEGEGLGIEGVENAIEIIHPNTEVFDVVVVQSSPLEDNPGGRGMLSGRPAYTVYVKVPGSAREWIMQYCIPNSTDGVKRTGSVIQLGNPAPVKPPYPLMMLVPDPAFLAKATRAMLYGFITAAGRFRELRPVRDEDEGFALKLVPFLKNWEFRPATRDGRPVEVELLLIVPPAGG